MGLLITVSLQPFPSVGLLGPWFDLLYLAPDLMAYPVDNRWTGLGPVHGPATLYPYYLTYPVDNRLAGLLPAATLLRDTRTQSLPCRSEVCGCSPYLVTGIT